jgi:hypothetical protein
MPKSKKTVKPDNINYKKLFFELMLVLAVIFAATCAILYPVLKEHGAFEDHTFDEYDELIKKVDELDYSKGRDYELEGELRKGYFDDRNAARQFYYGLAYAIYYCNIGYYNTAEEAFDQLYQRIPESKKARMDLESHDVICKRKQQKDV